MLERGLLFTGAVRASPCEPDRPSSARLAAETRRACANRPISKDPPMPEVIFTGPAGRLEGRYHPAKQKNAPIAMVLHPHPQFRGTMNHPIVYQVYYAFVASRLFGAALQFPRRRPQPGLVRPRHRRTVGCSSRARLGADHQPGSARLLGRRLLFRRLDRHAAADAPPGSRRLHLDRAAANLYDFSFLAPCPSSGPDRAWRKGCRGARPRTSRRWWRS